MGMAYDESLAVTIVYALPGPWCARRVLGMERQEGDDALVAERHAGRILQQRPSGATRPDADID
jgi:hypothetical protein